MKGFHGYLQPDAFSGYDRICAGPDVIEVTCWALVRRGFFESRTLAPVLAHAALARILQQTVTALPSKAARIESLCLSE